MVSLPRDDGDDVRGRRHDARRRAMTDRLLPVVEDLLRRGDGFAAITVEQILTPSGLSRTTFYRYFGDKTELLIALAEPVLDSILVAAKRPFDFEADLTMGRMEQELRRTMATYMQHLGLLGAMVEAATYDPRVRAKFRGVFDAVHEMLTSRLEDGQRSGYIRDDLPAWETAGWITWMAERGMSQLAATATDQGRDMLAQSLARLVWHGVFSLDGS
jgi:AcrR family transcriptional regulator